MPFLTNVPLPQCLQHSSATRCLLARDHDRGCMRHLLKVKCLAPRALGEVGGSPSAGAPVGTLEDVVFCVDYAAVVMLRVHDHDAVDAVATRHDHEVGAASGPAYPDAHGPPLRQLLV